MVWLASETLARLPHTGRGWPRTRAPIVQQCQIPGLGNAFGKHIAHLTASVCQATRRPTDRLRES